MKYLSISLMVCCSVLFLILCFCLIVKIKDYLINIKHSIKDKIEKLKKDTKVIFKSVKPVKFKIGKLHRYLYQYFMRQTFFDLILIINLVCLIFSICMLGIISPSSKIYSKIGIIMVISFFIFCFQSVYVSTKEDEIVINIQKIIFSYIIIIIATFASLWLFILLNKESINIAFLFICLLIVILFAKMSFQLATRLFNKKILIVFFTIPVYCFLILYGGFLFGVYYHLVFQIDVNSIKNLGQSKEFMNLIKKFIKFGIKFFYNFPEDKYICTVSVIQYLGGKFLDLFMLGYIFFKITEKNEPIQEQKSGMCEECPLKAQNMNTNKLISCTKTNNYKKRNDKKKKKIKS